MTDLAIPDENKWAWLAGFIDGEGSIGVHRERDRRKSETYFHYRPSLQINQIDLPVLQVAQAILGGGQIVKVATRHPNHRQAFHFTVRDRATLLAALPNLIPHLVLKRGHAEALLEFLQRRAEFRGRGRYALYTERDRELVAHLSQLNARGVAA